MKGQTLKWFAQDHLANVARLRQEPGLVDSQVRAQGDRGYRARDLGSLGPTPPFFSLQTFLAPFVHERKNRKVLDTTEELSKSED